MRTLEMHERFLGKLFNKAQRKHLASFQEQGKAINDKVRLYALVGQTLIEAKQSAADPFSRIEKAFLYLPYGDDFQERLAAHWANLNSMKWMLWNDGVDMAEFGMTRVRIGLFQHALAHPDNDRSSTR